MSITNRKSKLLGRAIAGLALGTGLVLALGACATPASPGGESSSSASSIEGKRITYVTFGQQYEFIVGLVSSVQKDLEAAGAVVTILDGKSDPNLQTTLIQDALAQQPDAIIVDPVDPSLMIAGIEKANAQGVPVFITETLPDGVDYAGFVGYDNVSAGVLGAQTLAELIGDTGTVLQLQGGVGSTQAQQRKEGFDTEMAKHPDIVVKDLKTEWTAENANSMTLDAFTTDPDVVGIWSHNDEMIRGAVTALAQLGLDAPAGEAGHISIVGHDGTPLALNRIRDGVQDASVVYDAIVMGQTTAANIIAYFSEKSFDKDTILKPFLANKDNIDDSKLWGNLPELQ